MAFEDIVVNNYGWVAELQVTEDGAPLDISTYTTLEMEFIAPDGTRTVKPAQFSGNGSDGKIKYVVEQGLIDKAGIWEVRAHIAKTGVDIWSVPIRFNVEEA